MSLINPTDNLVSADSLGEGDRVTVRTVVSSSGNKLARFESAMPGDFRSAIGGSGLPGQMNIVATIQALIDAGTVVEDHTVLTLLAGTEFTAQTADDGTVTGWFINVIVADLAETQPDAAPDDEAPADDAPAKTNEVPF